jgi:hypothetical protein
MEAHALHFEAVKYAYRQSKDGVVVSFVVHPNDVPPELAVSHIGARYMIAFVEIGDDEKPVQEVAQPTAAQIKAGAKLPWKDVPPAQQAGIRCSEAVFSVFLKEVYPQDWRESKEAAACVRLICAVESRAELTSNQKARVIWHQLDEQFQAWKALEHA